jgi:hypothetical protein
VRLLDLDPRFLKLTDERHAGEVLWLLVPSEDAVA